MTAVFSLLPLFLFWNKSSISENKENKGSSFVLNYCCSRKKYLSKLKRHELPDALSNEFLFQYLSVMSYEQFIVPIIKLIMLSRQQILSRNFHNMRVTWLFHHFLKSEIHILHGLENISIFYVWKL